MGESIELVDVISVDVKKYWADGQIYIPDNQELCSFEEYIVSNNGLDIDGLLLKIETANNAKEIAELCRNSITVNAELDEILLLHFGHTNLFKTQLTFQACRHSELELQFESHSAS